MTQGGGRESSFQGLVIIYFSISNVVAEMCLSSDNPLLYPYNLYFFNMCIYLH